MSRTFLASQLNIKHFPNSNRTASPCGNFQAGKLGYLFLSHRMALHVNVTSCTEVRFGSRSFEYLVKYVSPHHCLFCRVAKYNTKMTVAICGPICTYAKFFIKSGTMETASLTFHLRYMHCKYFGHSSVSRF